MVSRLKFSDSDLVLLDQICVAKAREDFWAFRRYIRPKMKVGWFQKDVARRLQRFALEMERGYAPKLVISAPPQHGKSIQIVDFIAWVSGRWPDLQSFYASFSDRLGVRANKTLQRVYDGERYKRVFPGTRISPPNSTGGPARNRDMLEYIGHIGYFRNTTVRGPITGETISGLGVVDDPLKGRLEANSPTVRDATWEWFTDDFLTRFDEHAALLIILTRWNVDDIVGRYQEIEPGLEVVKYRAIAIDDEAYRDDGDALFPELKSKAFLESRRKTLSSASWESLYQQSPFVGGGDMFPVEKFSVVSTIDRSRIMKSVRYWDKAGTRDGAGAETAGVLMHRMKDNTYVIEHVEHGRWAALEREKKIKHCAELDGYRTKIGVEQEPGSGGKESAEATIRNLPGFTVKADRPTGAKELRAEPYATQVQGGNFSILRSEWNRSFLDEHEHFPNGKLKDMVDAGSGAFAMLCDSTYDMEALAS